MRGLRWLLVAVLLLALVLVVADRVGVRAAQQAVADQIATELAANGIESAPPEVSIERVPFLTQVAAGRYESVTVWLRDVGTGEVRLPSVELVATGVTATVGTLVSGEGSITADRLDGTATIGYASVAALAEPEGLVLSGGEDGLLRVEVPAELLGTELTLTGAARVAAADGMVRLEVESLTVTDPVDLPSGADAVISGLAEQLSVAVPLPPLPYGLAIEEVAVARAGLVVTLSAEDVPLAG